MKTQRSQLVPILIGVGIGLKCLYEGDITPTASILYALFCILGMCVVTALFNAFWKDSYQETLSSLPAIALSILAACGFAFLIYQALYAYPKYTLLFDSISVIVSYAATTYQYAVFF